MGVLIQPHAFRRDVWVDGYVYFHELTCDALVCRLSDVMPVDAMSGSGSRRHDQRITCPLHRNTDLQPRTG